MNNYFDVIIVGAGSMGMAAGYFLAKQGINTLLLDAFDPPHSMGSHHGQTRLFRHAYTSGNQYVSLALRAETLWKDLESESGDTFFVQTGVISIGEVNSPFITSKLTSANAFSLPIELIQSTELHTRWPGISIPENFVGLLEIKAGVLYCEQAIQSYRKLASKYGATLLTNTPVEQISITSEGATVQTRDSSYFSDKLIISSGAWTNKLLTNLNIPLQPLRKTVAWFQSDEILYKASNFPAFIFNVAEGEYYGFPSFNESGIKIGRHDTGHQIDPDNKIEPFNSFQEDEGDLRNFLLKYLPGAAGKLLSGKTCIYTMTPDEHFILDQHPIYPHVIIASGFSGHGFKFASAIGETLSQLAIDKQSSQDISLFGLKRFNILA